MFSFIPLFLQNCELKFHGFESGFLLHHCLLDRVLLLFLLAFLVVELLLEYLHLLFVLFFNSLRDLTVTLRSGQIALFVLLYAPHLRLNFLDALGPGVLEQFAKVCLDLFNILLDRGEKLLFVFETAGPIGLFN